MPFSVGAEIDDSTIERKYSGRVQGVIFRLGV